MSTKQASTVLPRFGATGRVRVSANVLWQSIPMLDNHLMTALALYYCKGIFLLCLLKTSSLPPAITDLERSHRKRSRRTRLFACLTFLVSARNTPFRHFPTKPLTRRITDLCHPIWTKNPISSTIGYRSSERAPYLSDKHRSFKTKHAL